MKRESIQNKTTRILPRTPADLSIFPSSLLEQVGAIPKSRRLTVVFELPPASKAEESKPILELALNLVDVLAGSTLPNEILKKTVSMLCCHSCFLVFPFTTLI